MKKEAMKEIGNQDTARKFMSFSFIYSMLFNRLSKAELDDYHKIMNFYDEGCIINIEVNLEQKGSFYVDYKMLCVFYQEIQKKIPEGYYCMTGPLISHRIILYLSKDTSEMEKRETLLEEYRAVGEDILTMLALQGKLTVRVGIGSWRPISEIGTSYEEALRCIRYQEDSSVVLIEDCGDYLPGIQEYDEIKKKFLSSIKFGEEISLIYLNQIMELISVLNLDAQKNLLMELLVLAVSEVYNEENEKEEGYIDFIEYAVELSNIGEQELGFWVHQKFQYITKILRQRHVDKKDYVIKNVLAYLEEHYQEDISLSDAADQAGMTPQYFSTIFKQAMGQNFVEWMSEYRIHKAMEYLDEPGAVIKEVCFKVGYNDPNYFSRIFKKISGMTPKEYMAQKE